MVKTYTKKFPLYTFDVDAEGKAHLPVLLNFLQEVARDHAALLKVSIFDLLDRGLTWILSRYHIRVPRYPSMGDEVEITTWPSGKKGVFALRDFEARDGSGRLLLEATTSWLVIKVDGKQPIKMDTLFLDENIIEKRAIEDPFERLEAPARTDFEASFRVLRRDLDFNRHVNNVSYIQWAIEGMPEEVLRSRRPFEVEIVYKAETLYGDDVLTRVEFPAQGSSEYLHAIVNRATGAELARLKTTWR
jgi:medium-chain acyl-[acyl-carrier-protein] hydrolase